MRQRREESPSPALRATSPKGEVTRLTDLQLSAAVSPALHPVHSPKNCLLFGAQRGGAAVLMPPPRNFVHEIAQR